MYQTLFLRITQCTRYVKTDVSFKPSKVLLFKSVLPCVWSHSESYSRPACFYTKFRLCPSRCSALYVRNYHSNFGVYGFCPHSRNTYEGRYKPKCSSKTHDVSSWLFISVDSCHQVKIILFPLHELYIARILPVLKAPALHNNMASSFQRRQ
jgi:hypothetical protein